MISVIRTLGLAVAMAVASAMAAHAQQAERTAAELIADFESKAARGDAIVAEIGAIHARDQLLRELIIDGFKTIKSEEVRLAYIDGTRHVFTRVDDENTKRLEAVLQKISWDELEKLSPGAAEDALSIISHTSDFEFKRRMTALFEPLALSGKMDGQNYANLFDDIRVHEGKPQRYGTNFDCIDGRQQPRPTEDMAGLNARRAALGMMPIEEYAKIIEEMYGPCPAK